MEVFRDLNRPAESPGQPLGTVSVDVMAAERFGSSGVVSPQQEAAGCDPLDELYDALGEVVTAADTPVCYKSYLLVPDSTRSGAVWDGSLSS